MERGIYWLTRRILDAGRGSWGRLEGQGSRQGEAANLASKEYEANVSP